METNIKSPPYSQENQCYMPPPPPYHQVQNAISTGSAEVLRQTSEVLYGQYSPQQINANINANTSPNLTNINTVNNNTTNSGCVPSMQHGQMQQTMNRMPTQLSQQSCQQTSTTSCTQQPLNAIDSDNVTPVWAIHLMQNLGQQLQNIQQQLEGQNQRWQAIESKIEHQNVRMTNMETQMSHLNTMKQSFNKTINKVESLDTDIKSVQKKISEYDRSIQSYSDICDEVTYSNSQTEAKISHILDKVNTLEGYQNQLENKLSQTDEKLIDIQWRSMRENLIFTGIPESELRQGEQENCEALIKEFLKSEMNIFVDIQFDRVHRLGRYKPNQHYPRPIIAKFTNYKDKEYVKKAAPRTLIGTQFRVNEHFPQEIENRRKQLYPEAKKARQNKNNEVRLVCDKLFINGRQFLPNTNDSQNSTSQNIPSYRKNYTNSGIQSESFHRRTFNEQPRFNNNVRYQRQQQNQTQSEENWQQQKYRNPRRDVPPDNPRRHETRTAVSWEVPLSNRFETTSQLQNTPQRMGKKKATSPIDTEVTMKKQKECEPQNECIITNQVKDNVITGEQLLMQPRKLNDDSISILSPNQEVQLQMPMAVDSATLYYGPDKVHTEQTKSSNINTEAASHNTNFSQVQAAVEMIDGTEAD